MDIFCHCEVSHNRRNTFSALSEASTLFFTIVKLAFFLGNILENTFLITTGNDQSIQLMAKSFNRRLRLSMKAREFYQSIWPKSKTFNQRPNHLTEVWSVQPKAKAYKQIPILSNKGPSIQLKDKDFDWRLKLLTK